MNKLIKHEIYEKINFPQANFGEDRQIIIQAIHHANKIDYTKRLLYHYYNNEDSLCNNNDKMWQRYLDEAEITAWIINFLQNNYNTSLDIFEPELSDGVNLVKLHFALEKHIRNFSIFHEFYPASNHSIFSSTSRASFEDKLILFLSVHDRTFMLVDIFSAIFHTVRTVYRIIVPRNLRNVILYKRNKFFA